MMKHVSMHQSIMAKIKYSGSENWVVQTIVKYSIKIFECQQTQK